MTNFTEEIKTEIIENFTGGRDEILAALSAFIRTSGALITENGNYGFELYTESRAAADFFSEIIENELGISLDAFSSRSDVSSGRDKSVISCVSEKTSVLLSELGIIGCDSEGYFVNFTLDEGICEVKEKAAAYIMGAFLGGGSCTVPDIKSYSRTGYHFEIVFRSRITAGDFCDLLCSFDVLAKLVMRKDSAVVYLKSKEAIASVLNLFRAKTSLEKLEEIVRLKGNSNNENRVSNCSVSNIDKTVTASVNQVRAIEVIRSTIGLQALDENLFSVAQARLADKNASLQELARRLGISKSCLNHRLRKLTDISAALDKD